MIRVPPIPSFEGFVLMVPVVCHGSYLRHFKRVVRDRSMFEDNQVDPIALEEYLKSVEPSEEDSTTPVEEEKVRECLLVLFLT